MQAVYQILTSLHFGWILVAVGFIYYIIQSFFIIYHLTRFGIGPKPKLLALIFVAGSCIFLFLAAIIWVQASLPSYQYEIPFSF